VLHPPATLFATIHRRRSIGCVGHFY
jgi:hypothetical protein